MVRVRVDHREAEDVLRGLRAAGADVVRSTLKLGDITNDTVCIEFKRSRDFIDSLLDRRLDSQCLRLAKDPRTCFVLIAGTLEEVERQYFLRVKENMVWGMVGSIATRYGVNIIWIYRDLKGGGMKQAMYVAHKLCRAGAEGKLGKPRFIRKRNKRNLKAGPEAIKRAFGVPEKAAIALHVKFKSLSGVCAASKARLRLVQGVGPKRAELIYSKARA